MSTKSFITVAATVFSLLSCTKSVNYEQFGAKGDGITDDFPAIIAAHKAANERGLPVKVAAKTYYIGKTIGTAEILTDVDFGKASFIIDDRDITPEERYANIFSVNSASEPFDIEGVSTLKRGQKSLGVTLPGRCLIEVENNNKKVYIRFGPNQNNGTGEKEFFIADSQGKIEEASAIVWDYDEITKIKGRIIDEKPLVIKGGTFTTLANRAPSEYTYYGRGFQIARSNVRLENITHYIEEELDHGAPYSGFMTFSNAADITVSDCLFTAHKTYRTIGSASTPVSMGSYDISA
ncbi:MAG: hypothetical protein HUJ93_03475, partial [Bacteroidales bacterium]|nr:hypothetical protein [Bacteroidales bacterium]